ncbi:hypothetical protein HKCCE3408_08380 [Rhodobacterales bacterium HKCCE3408]|nr:hypothetical protein [Rhodobacterales bacterium HKCCE3408]
MKYMLQFREDADEQSKHKDPAQQEAYFGGWGAYIGSIAQAGVMVSGEGLLSPDTAKTLRIENGSRQISDGPFADITDIKEMLSGYVIIDVHDLDAALEWAAKAPCVTAGSVEVRPVLPQPSA